MTRTFLPDKGEKDSYYYHDIFLIICRKIDFKYMVKFY